MHWARDNVIPTHHMHIYIQYVHIYKYILVDLFCSSSSALFLADVLCQHKFLKPGLSCMEMQPSSDLHPKSVPLLACISALVYDPRV